MPITRKFRTTVMDRAVNDPAFRRQMLTEAVNELLAGDLDAGKAMLRDYINATITFQQLAKKLKKTDKSVHRMLGPRGNPRADNILEIIKILQANERVKLRVEAHKAAAWGMSSRKTDPRRLLFTQWFDIEFHSLVIDLVDAPLEDEE